MLAICNNLGVLSDHFFPAESATGFDYTLSPYLERIREHRNDFTVFSGVWHPDVDGGHPADICFLTAAPAPGSGSFRNTISLDQYMAEQLGQETRFPTLTLGVNTKSRSLSWTGGGVAIPCEDSPSKIYQQLFLQGNAEEVAQQLRRLELGQSIMDAVGDRVSALGRTLGHRDRERMDQYVTGVRDLERRMQKAEEWVHRPKPKAIGTKPKDIDDPRAYMAKTRLMYDMARIAFESDSTRLITLMLDSVNSPAISIEGVDITDGYHSLSHHGRNSKKMEQLKAIDEAHMDLLGELYSKLKDTLEFDSNLLDRTMVLYGSNLGNAQTHVTINMPVLLAGGGFRHGQHLAFDRERNYPLPNLFVSMLQRMGLPADKFVSSTGSMRGLDLA